MRRAKTTYWLIMLMLSVAVSTGCVSVEQEDEEGWGVCDECGTSPIPQGSDEPDDNSHPSQQTLEELEPCLPQADHGGNQSIPELPDGILDGQCSLDEQVEDYDGDGDSERVIRWRQDGEIIEQTVEDRGRLWQKVTFELGATGELRRVQQRQYFLYYANGYSDEEWVFDAHGRLTSNSRMYWREHEGRETLQRAQEVSQSWRNGRLVARTEVSSYGGDENRVSYRWRYDGQGRMLEAHVDKSPSGTSSRTRWHYTNGRPVSVERSVDGVLVARHGWQYHDDGVVSAHDVAYGQHGLEEDASEVDAHLVPPMDSYHAPNPFTLYTAYAQIDNPWRAANAQVDTQRGCYTLPGSLGHGYPHDEPAYQLGWGDGDSQSSIRFSSGYGYGAYGYGYGQQAWYGHTGVGTPWPMGQSAARGVVTARLRYDRQGQMTAETLDFAPYADDHAHSHVPLAAVHVERRRRFDAVGLLEDRITVESDEDVYERTLRFERDEQGRLRLRALWQGDERLAFQTWDYDRQGAITQHDVHVPQEVQQMPATLVGLLAQEVEEPVHTATYERHFDGRRRMKLVAAQEHLHARQRREITIEHGEYGPVEETRRFRNEHTESVSSTVYEYDARGRNTAKLHDYDGNGEVDTATRFVYEDDRLVEVAVSNGNTTRVTSMSYTCE